MHKLEGRRFINAEPSILIQNDSPIPAVILSFGAEEGPVEDRAVGIIDARQMAIDILSCLAYLGDPMAQAIGSQFFGAKEDGSEPDSNEFDGDEGGCGDGGCCGGGGCG